MDNETTAVTLSTPKDKTDLMERIQREWSALLQTIENQSHEQMTRPGTGGWSTKDNLAHLAAWERFMLLHYLQGLAPYEAMQIDQARFERLDEDGINAILYERNRNRSITDILGDLHRTHAQVLAALEPMTYDDLMKPLYADDPQKRPLIGWVIGNTYEHYQEHRKVIQTTTDE